MFGFGRREGRDSLKREHSNRSSTHHNSFSSLHAEELSATQRHLSEAKSALQDAEAKILSLERSRDGDTRRLWEMQEELCKVEAERDKKLSLLRLDKKRLEAELESERENVLKLEREWSDESSATEYAALVEEVISSPDPHHPPYRSAGGGGADSRDEKIHRLKHHLTRALRRMELLSSRAASVQSSCDALVKRLREEYAHDLDVKCQDQVKIMNQLAVHRLEKDDLEEQKRMEMEGHQKAIRVLEERLEESERRKRELEEAAKKVPDQIGGGKENTLLNDGGVNEAATRRPPQDGSPSSDQSKHTDALHSRPTPSSSDIGSSDDKDLERELRELLRSKDEMEENFRREAKDRDRMIAWLEEENYVKDRLIRKLQRGGESSSIDGSGGSLGSDGIGLRRGSGSVGSSGSLRQGGTGDGKDGDAESSADDLHSSQSTASHSASGVTHPPPAAEPWMNPLDASLMGMSFSVIQASPQLDGGEEVEDGAKDGQPMTIAAAAGNEIGLR